MLFRSRIFVVKVWPHSWRLAAAWLVMKCAGISLSAVLWLGVFFGFLKKWIYSAPFALKAETYPAYLDLCGNSARSVP